MAIRRTLYLKGESEPYLRSKSHIDRIGEELATSPKSPQTIQAARAYRMFRLAKIEECISTVLQCQPPTHSLLSARLKRLSSIRRKLIRSHLRGYPTKLSRIDDIIGIRVVCDYYSEALGFSSRLKATSHNFKDYIAKPQETGYRAIHHIFKVDQPLPTVPEETPASFTFEVQIRTYHQQQWGVWSESYGEQAKENRALSKTKEHLQKLSGIIKCWEERNKDKRQDSLPPIAADYSLAIVQRHEDLASSFHYFPSELWKRAIDQLFYFEKEASSEDDILLLAGVDDLDNLGNTLRLTHPTFFRKVFAPISIESNCTLQPKWAEQ